MSTRIRPITFWEYVSPEFVTDAELTPKKTAEEVSPLPPRKITAPSQWGETCLTRSPGVTKVFFEEDVNLSVERRQWEMSTCSQHILAYQSAYTCRPELIIL